MRNQHAGSRAIRAAVIFLALAIGVVIALAILPQLVSINISPGPEQCYSGLVPYCSAPYIAIENTSLFPVTLTGWEIGYGNDMVVLPTRTLFPGQAIQLWSGSGPGDVNNWYAGREESAWVLKGVYVRGKVFYLQVLDTQVFWSTS